MIPCTCGSYAHSEGCAVRLETKLIEAEKLIDKYEAAIDRVKMIVDGMGFSTHMAVCAKGDLEAVLNWIKK